MDRICLSSFFNTYGLKVTPHKMSTLYQNRTVVCPLIFCFGLSGMDRLCLSSCFNTYGLKVTPHKMSTLYQKQNSCMSINILLWTEWNRYVMSVFIF